MVGELHKHYRLCVGFVVLDEFATANSSERGENKQKALLKYYHLCVECIEKQKFVVANFIVNSKRVRGNSSWRYPRLEVYLCVIVEFAVANYMRIWRFNKTSLS